MIKYKKNFKNWNISYKEIECENLHFPKIKSALVNKKFQCVVDGNESENDNKSHDVKNDGKLELLKVEDELHEFDTKII